MQDIQVVDIKYASEHFIKNTYNDAKANINATTLPTLSVTLIVIQVSVI